MIHRFRAIPPAFALLVVIGLIPVHELRAEPLPESLATLAKQHRHPLTLEQGRIGDAGGDLLVEEAGSADLLLFGENHGVAEIAELAHALYRVGRDGHPRRLVTEIGPASALEVEPMVRDGSLRDFLRGGVNLHALPFFSWVEELPLLESAVAAFPDQSPAIWGIDQEFIAAPPLLLPRLERQAGTQEQRDAVAAARRASWLNPFLFGMGSGATLQRLQHAFADGDTIEAQALTEQLVLSHQIYREQMGGDPAWSNERRETLMMENFTAHVGEEEDVSPMFFKLGAFHLFQGRSPAVPEALGLRLSRWAEDRGLSTLGVFVDCHGGSQRDALLGRAVACDSFLEKYAPGLHRLAFEEGWTLLDLRPLRGHPALEQASPWVRHTVAGYDFVLLVREPRAATFLPGSLATRVYGAAFAGLALSMLTLTAWGVVRFWRRRRRLGASDRSPAPATPGE
jgi:hypothetical protein